MAKTIKAVGRYETRMQDGKTIGYTILSILQHIAPDKAAQDACTLMFLQAKGPSKHQDTVMAGALYDGLAYGNWPWVKVGETDAQVSEVR